MGCGGVDYAMMQEEEDVDGVRSDNWLATALMNEDWFTARDDYRVSQQSMTVNL